MMFCKIFAKSRLALSKWLYRQAAECFTAGRHRRGSDFFRAYMMLAGERDARGKFENSSDQEIATFLSERMTAWLSGDIELPSYCASQLPGDEINLSTTKMLIVVSQFINNDPKYIENEMKDHLLTTASAAGIEADVFYFDDCSYPLLLGVRHNAPQALQAFRQKVLEFGPDIIFLDINFIGTEDSINSSLLSELKLKTGVTIIGFIGDAWAMPIAEQLGAYWLPACDAIYHHTPDTPLEDNYFDHLILAAYPTNRERFRPQENRDIPLSFLGSAPPARAYMLAKVREFEALGAKLTGHERDNSAASIDEYAEIMRRSRIVLDFSGAKAARVNGRVFQSLNSGCLLLAEQNNEKTSAFFVPYVHYVPFANAKELYRLVRFFSKHEELRKAIGDAAATLCDEKYTERRIWLDILSKARRIKMNAKNLKHI